MQSYRVPFRRSLSKNDVLNFLEESPLGRSESQQSVSKSVGELDVLDHHAQRKIVDGIKRDHRHTKKKMANQSHSRTNPSDSDLLGSMASRLALVERELLASKREVIVKDNYIRELEERVTVLERAIEMQSFSSAGQHFNEKQELEIKCLALQKQVDDMEVIHTG